MNRRSCVAGLVLTFLVGCGGMSNPFSRGPEVDPRFLTYGPPPTDPALAVRSKVESQVTPPDVLKTVEVGEPKKASYFPPELNSGNSGKPVEYLGWKAEAKYTVTSPSGGITINRRVFFFNNGEIVATDRAGTTSIR
jgi:hypothetical protein